MQSKKFLLFTLLFLLVSSFTVFAQDEEDNNSDSDDKSSTMDDYPYPSVRSEEYKDFVPEKRHDQQDKFMDNKYTHPAKPRDKWELGINAGLLMISGDVKARPGFGVGGHIRKSLSYVMSMRGSFMAGTTYGKNWEATDGWSISSRFGDHFVPNRALAGSGGRYDEYNDQRTPDYWDEVNGRGQPIFYNYKTLIREAVMSCVVNTHNLRFHKRETKLSHYCFAGIGGVAYRAFMDQLDANGNEYNYSQILNTLVYEDRSTIVDALDNLWDGDYESQAERHFDDYTPFDNFSYKPTAHVGLGVAYKLSRKMNIGLETKVTYTNDDLLDGQRWQEWGALTRDYDTYIYTALGLNFNLGAKNSVEPLWWMNPLDYSYQELGEAPCCEEMVLPDLSDDDKDGVPNIFDEEPDSREGCPVDTKGRMLDSDRDGVLDCDDKCPHTAPFDINGEPRGEVDEFGCAPAVKLKLSCNDIPDICDCARRCVPPQRPVVQRPRTCCERPLPNILFDLNRYSVKPAFEAQLAEVARYLRDPMCSEDRIAVIGHTDNRNGNSYNDVLSYKRAQEVISKLTTQYGIPRSRLVLMYRGENAPSIAGLSTVGQKGIDADHALNRRVEFRCAMPGDVDMGMPAGPRGAGSRKPKP